MDGVALEPEAHQKRVDVQDLLHLAQDADGAAAAGGHGLHAIYLADGAGGGPVGFRADRDRESVAALAGRDFHLDIFRGDLLEVALEQARDLGAALVRDQAHRDFGVRLGREHGLGARAGVAAPDAADVQARADSGALEGGVSLLAAHLADIQKLLVFLHVKGRPGEHLAVRAGELGDLVVESGHGHAPVGVYQRGDHLAEHLDGVRHGAAVVSGMQVLVGPGHLDFQVAQATHAAVDGGDLVADHRGVADQADVRFQELAVGLDPGRQRGAADLLLALEEELDVVGELAAAHEVFEGLDVHEQLALVVVGSAAPDGFVVHLRVEGIVIPLVQRLHRLDVVVAIDQHGAGLGIDDLLAEDDRMAGGLADAGFVGARFQQQVGEGLGAEIHVGLVLGPGADGGDAQEGEEFFEEALPVLFDVFSHDLRRVLDVRLRWYLKVRFP